MKWTWILLGLGLGLLAGAHLMGLLVAPSERYMANVGRILYVHVPTAWVSLLCFTVAFIAAIGALWTGRVGWDALMAGASEVGVVLTGLLLFQGAVWAKPTWGTWWASASPACSSSAPSVGTVFSSCTWAPERRVGS